MAHSLSLKITLLRFCIVAEYLTPNGVFILKAVYRNTSCVEFDMLIAGLWDQFLTKYSSRRRIEGSDSLSISDPKNFGYKHQSEPVDMNGDGYESSVIV